MADPNSSIFNKTATERLRSPDDLDKYVRVTNPSVWALLIACAALLAGILAWGVFGTVSTSVSATAAHIDDGVVCLLDAESAAKVSVGDQAVVNGTLMQVESISDVPLSRQELNGIIESDYLASTLAQAEWSYVVTLSGPGAESLAPNVPLSVSITIESVAPISLIFGA